MKELKEQGTEKELNLMLLKYKKLILKAMKVIEVKQLDSEGDKATALDFLQMAQNYYKDGQYFEQQGNKLTALAAFSYAYAWLDAGIRAGLFDGKGHRELFTLKK